MSRGVLFVCTWAAGTVAAASLGWIAVSVAAESVSDNRQATYRSVGDTTAVGTTTERSASTATYAGDTLLWELPAASTAAPSVSIGAITLTAAANGDLQVGENPPASFPGETTTPKEPVQPSGTQGFVQQPENPADPPAPPPVDTRPGAQSQPTIPRRQADSGTIATGPTTPASALASTKSETRAITTRTTKRRPSATVVEQIAPLVPVQPPGPGSAAPAPVAPVPDLTSDSTLPASVAPVIGGSVPLAGASSVTVTTASALSTTNLSIPSVAATVPSLTPTTSPSPTASPPTVPATPQQPASPTGAPPATPTGAPPATPTVAPTLPATVVPTTSATVPVSSAAYTLRLGTVGVHCNAKAISLDFATPFAGATVKVEHASGESIELKFRRGGDEEEFHAKCINGVPHKED